MDRLSSRVKTHQPFTAAIPKATGRQSDLRRSPEPADWMKAALREAQKAALIGEVPIGAVIVRDGRIIARGHNQRETVQDVTLHAEMVVIRKACRKLRSWRLDGCELYVTLEPCVMCAGAIVQARLATVCFGAFDPKAGAAGSITNIFTLPQNHVVPVQSGVLQPACSQILKDFFAERRLKDKQSGSRSIRRGAAIDAMIERQTGQTGRSRSVDQPGRSD